jgi:tetratricopeptide (TPR) repeat protein
MDRLRAIRGLAPADVETDAGNGEQGNANQAADGQPLLIAPESEELREAREQREQAVREHMRRSLGFDPVTGKVISDENDADAESDSETVERMRRLEALLQGQEAHEGSGRSAKERAAYEKFMARMRYDLPAIRSLAGEGNSAVNNITRKAQDLLAQGQYMDAEREFAKLVSALPQYPMARVGLIHAQLGAGMFQSASLNLRQLLTRHPELAATRYDVKLLPDKERLGEIRDKLDDMIKTDRRPDSGIALAYLGYQTSNDQLVAFGLDKAQAKAPSDPTIILLRQVWLGSSSDQAKPADQEETSD